MTNAIGRGLQRILGLHQIRPAWRQAFADHSYRVSADRAQRVAWAVFLVDLPLFGLIDWRSWADGAWAIEPAHAQVFWWRVGLSVAILLMLGLRLLVHDERRSNAVFAWANAIGFPLLGVWFVLVSQPLSTDASIYVLFLVGASVLFPMPTPYKLLIYPATLLLLLWGVLAIPTNVGAEFYVAVNASCAAIGALVTEAVALRTYVADFAKSQMLEEERTRADEMLCNVLPAPIVSRLSSGGTTVVEFHPAVSVLFADFAGFGRLAQALPPSELIALLDHLFLEFDEAADRFGVEKIKTLGDSYMAACGVPMPMPDHAARLADLALRMQVIAGRFQSDRQLPVQFRIGIHTGPAIAGVIGRRKFCYDLWGDTINIASHLQSAGEPGRIHVSAELRAALSGTYRFEIRDPIRLKGREAMQTYFLLGRAGEGELFKDRLRAGGERIAASGAGLAPLLDA